MFAFVFFYCCCCCFLTCPCEDVGERATVNFQGNVTKSQVFHPCANSTVCVCFMRCRIHVFLPSVLKKKKKEEDDILLKLHVDPYLWLNGSQMSQLLLRTHPHSLGKQKDHWQYELCLNIWCLLIRCYLLLCDSAYLRVSGKPFPTSQTVFLILEIVERQLPTSNPACRQVGFPLPFFKITA